MQHEGTHAGYAVLGILGTTAKEENMRDKRIPQNKRVGEPLSVVYSIKVTQSQRIALMRLGPQWVREQIEKAKHDKAPQS